MKRGRRTAQIRRSIAYLGLLASLLGLLNSCAFFSKDYTWEKRVEARCATIHKIEAQLDAVDTGLFQSGGASALVDVLSKVEGIKQISQVGETGARFQFDDGTWGNVIIDVAVNEEESTSGALTLPNYQVQIDSSEQHAPKAGVQHTCAPWTSGRALIVLAAPKTIWPYDDYRATVGILRASGYAVDALLGEEFTPRTVLSFDKYGVIILIGHGSNDVFQTGVPYESKSDLLPYKDLEEMDPQPIEPIIIKGDTDHPVESYIAFNANLLYLIPNRLPSSLVYLNGCYTTWRKDLLNDPSWVIALRSKGAAVILGNSDFINVEAAGNGAKGFCKYFFEESYRLGEAVEEARNYGLIKASMLEYYGDPLIQGNAWPIATVSANPTSGAAPLEVSFDASHSHDPDGDALTYQWFFGDGAEATGETASHTYKQSGDYEATLFATDPCGHEGKATTTIHVEQNPCEIETKPPVLTLNCPSSASSGSADFSWSAIDNCSDEADILFSYKLDDQSWSTWSHVTNKSYDNLTTGSHTFCVKARDKLGNESDPKCCQIEVNPCLSDNTPPVVTLDCPQGVSTGNVTLTWHGKDNCTPESEIQYQYIIYEVWSSWTTATSKTYSNLSSGSYTFCVRAKDTSGNISKEVCCTFKVDKCLNDSTPPSLTLNCGNPSGSGDVDFSWSASDDCASTSRLEYRHRLEGYENWSNWGDLKEAHYHSLQAGSYTFCVQVKDPNGNTSEKCCTIAVQGCTNNPQIWTDKSTYCIGDPITIYMRFTAPCTASLLDEKQGSYTKYLFQNRSYDVGAYTISGEIDGPAGSETLTVNSTACGSTESDSVTIVVENCGEGPRPGETDFYGIVLSEPDLIGAKRWIVQIERVDYGVDILPLGQVSVVMGVYPGCQGKEIGDIQSGDAVWVYGYFDGTSVDLCPNSLYYISKYGRPI